MNSTDYQLGPPIRHEERPQDVLKPYVSPDGRKVPDMYVDHNGRMVYTPPTPSLFPTGKVTIPMKTPDQLLAEVVKQLKDFHLSLRGM